MKTAKLILLFSLVFWLEPSLSQNVSVMTYNIRLSTTSDSLNYWEYRKEEMLDFLTKEKLDIIGFQEVLLNQLEYLKVGLKGYQQIGVGRDDGKSAGEFSPIFVDTVRFDVIESGTFWLSETPEKPSKGWDAALNRICTWAKLEEKSTKKCLLVFNTHFDHVGKIARDSSSRLIIRLAEEKLRQEKVSLIAIGDFNSEPNEAVIQNFRKSLNDASSNSNDSMGLGTFNGFKAHQNDFKQIDYIFYIGLDKKNFRTIRPLRSNQLQLSDHYAVTAIFGILK